MNKKITLSVKDLELWFDNDYGAVKILNKISFDIYKGETLGIVGESGCGKSMTSLCIMQLLDPTRAHVMGSIRFQGRDLLKLNDRKMQQVRGKQISMIFQEPMTSLNPVYPIGDQLCETFVQHQGMTKKQAMGKALELMRLVRIPEPDQRLKEYPYQLSGGMRQRVMIAMALACRPELLIADEPTTALDVTIQAQILDLLRNLKDKINSSIMFITHDLGVIAEMADYVVVMYAGRIVEQGTAEEIFAHPAHPYTIGLMASKPVVGRQVEKLYSIPGKVPNPINMPDYCYFKDRCEMCVAQCSGEYPCEVSISPTHKVSCYRYYDGKRPDLEEQVEREMTGSADNGKEGE